MADDLQSRLVTANHVLANEGILDAFGHVSVRDPTDAAFLVGERGPAQSMTTADVRSLPLDWDAEEPGDTYRETAIHRAIYRARDDVGAVVHHHAPSIMPFTVTDVALEPVYHLGAFLSGEVPVFEDYATGGGRLIVGEGEATSMAEQLGSRRVQLLEGHGANVVGGSLASAVAATVYLTTNASHQYRAEQLGEPRYFSGPTEALETMTVDVAFAEATVDRVWTYLVGRLE